MVLTCMASYLFLTHLPAVPSRHQVATNRRKILFLPGTPFYSTIFFHEMPQPQKGNPARGAEQL